MADIEQYLKVPRTVDELGVPAAMVQDLTLRRALFEGRTSTLRLSQSLCVNPVVMTEVVEELRELRYIEVHGLEGRDYQLGLTDFGREVAGERMRLCRFAGAVPVPLESYRQVVLAQKVSSEVSLDLMANAFADLVVNQELLDELGPALLAEGAMFLYGPPGTGKTSIAERLIRIHDDPVFIPRCVEVDSQVITVFDPIVHVPIEPQPEDIDPRWVLCRRPCIIAGGELTASMLDLTHEVTNGIYLAPLQMQANNGIFVIDDFGRQSLTPEQLLNRWIVPLDRRVDYLSLSYGVKFQIPFDCKVVFSTNLQPSSLGDEAFFRRIQNKILVPSITDEEFDTVLGRAAERFGVTIEPGAAAYLRRISREQGDGDLRPYLPIEVCKILKAVCTYRREPLVLSPSTIDAVARVYFTHARAMSDERAAAMEHAPAAGGGRRPPAADTGPADDDHGAEEARAELLALAQAAASRPTGSGGSIDLDRVQDTAGPPPARKLSDRRPADDAAPRPTPRRVAPPKAPGAAPTGGPPPKIF